MKGYPFGLPYFFIVELLHKGWVSKENATHPQIKSPRSLNCKEKFHDYYYNRRSYFKTG